MVDGQLNPRIELEAARLAVQWKSLFAAELQAVAQQLAGDAECITVEHFRCALPTATAKVLNAVKTNSPEAIRLPQRAA